MNKLTNNILAIALSAIIYPAYAVIIDDESATKTDKQEMKKQELNKPEMEKETRPSKNNTNKKSTTKQDVMDKKIPSKKHSDDNNSSMNKKPIGTTSGVTHNGSTDDTKLNEPINGTTTGTNPDANSTPATTTK